MRLKEIKPGMAIICHNAEQAAAAVEQLIKHGAVTGCNSTCYSDVNNILFYNFDNKFTFWDAYEATCDFSDLILPELTANEVFFIMSEIHKEAYKKYSGCVGCPISEVAQYCDADCFAENADKIIEICQQWKSDHEKKEPEIETVDICRIIEIQPDGRKRCVHEEDIKPDPELPYGSEQIAVHEILKHYCMEHEGEFIAVHEVVSRVKK